MRGPTLSFALWAAFAVLPAAAAAAEPRCTDGGNGPWVSVQATR